MLNDHTPRELGPSGPSPGEGGDLEPETVQAFLDSLVEEIHISDDEFGLWDTEQAAGEQVDSCMCAPAPVCVCVCVCS